MKGLLVSLAGKNAFDVFDLDPSSTVAELTAILRERTELASTEHRALLRDAWEELTLHPERRLLLALTAFPETREMLAPMPAVARVASITEAPLDLLDFIDPLNLEAALWPQAADEQELFAPPAPQPSKRL